MFAFATNANIATISGYGRKRKTVPGLTDTVLNIMCVQSDLRHAFAEIISAG